MLGTRVDGYDQSGDEVVARELGRGGRGCSRGRRYSRGALCLFDHGVVMTPWCDFLQMGRLNDKNKK